MRRKVGVAGSHSRSLAWRVASLLEDIEDRGLVLIYNNVATAVVSSYWKESPRYRT